MIDRFGKRVRYFSLASAACMSIFLAACGSGAPSGTAPASPVPHSLIEGVLATARILTVTYTPGTEPPSVRSQPVKPTSVTITDLARVREVSGLIDGLSLVSPNAVYACPAFTRGVVNLTFKNSRTGRTLAAAKFNVSGCPAMDLSIAGVQYYLNASGIVRRVLQISGIQAPTGN